MPTAYNLAHLCIFIVILLYFTPISFHFALNIQNSSTQDIEAKYVLVETHQNCNF